MLHALRFWRILGQPLTVQHTTLWPMRFAFVPMLLLPMVVRAQASAPRVQDAALRVAPKITDIRHTIHANPELGNREVETAKLIADQLRSLGIETRTGVARTGVVGILRGGKPGPVVAVRADMDALPVTEDTDLPFRSTKRGTYLGKDVGLAHACGHDIHVSVQLGVATVLAGMRDQLPGTVIFIFQPAEEGPFPEDGVSGAEAMLAQGVFDNPKPSAVFGLHTYPQLEVGKIGYTPGPEFAQGDRFVIKVKGRQAHGAQPNLSVDPVVTAAQVVVALQTIRSRNVSPLAPSVVTIGKISGGERHNIIPSEVEMIGTVRTFEPETQALIKRRMREIVDGVTKAAGATFELDYQEGSSPLVNDTTLALRGAAAINRELGAGVARVVEPTTGGEDFALLAKRVPGFFFFLGTTKPGTTSGGWHTPTYRGDDGAIPVGVRAMSAVILDYLGRGGR